MSSLLVCSLALVTNLAVPTSKAPPPASENGITTSAPIRDPNTPPPSTYDQTPRFPADGVVPDREPFGLAQWARTIFALVVVLSLIYLSKFALARLTGLRSGGLENNLSVIERVQLDPKHALFIVDIKDSGRVLLGGGNGDLRLLANLDDRATSPASPPGSGTLAQPSAPANESTTPGEYQS